MQEPIERRLRLPNDPVLAELFARMFIEIDDLRARLSGHERALGLSNQGRPRPGQRRLRLIAGTARRRTPPRGKLQDVDAMSTEEREDRMYRAAAEQIVALARGDQP